MSGTAGLLPRPQPRLRKSALAACGLFALALLCEALLTRGFLTAAVADSAAFTGRAAPDGLTGVVYGVVHMATAWASGAFHPRHLESWERSSFPISFLAVSAFGLSVYVRKRRW